VEGKTKHLRKREGQQQKLAGNDKTGTMNRRKKQSKRQSQIQSTYWQRGHITVGNENRKTGDSTLKNGKTSDSYLKNKWGSGHEQKKGKNVIRGTRGREKMGR